MKGLCPITNFVEIEQFTEHVHFWRPLYYDRPAPPGSPLVGEQMVYGEAVCILVSQWHGEALPHLVRGCELGSFVS